MEINEMNYELYAIDYAEGKLSGDTLVAMESFLAAHPHIAEELELVCATSLPLSTEVVYPNKAKLKQNHRPIPVYKIGFAVSSAACLVLALGWLALLNKSEHEFGALAYQPKFVNIDIHVNVHPNSESVATEAQYTYENESDLSNDLPINEQIASLDNSHEGQSNKDVDLYELNELKVVNPKYQANVERTEQTEPTEYVKEQRDFEQVAIIDNQKEDDLRQNDASVTSQIDMEDLALAKETHSAITTTIVINDISSNTELLSEYLKKKEQKAKNRQQLKSNMLKLVTKAVVPEGLTAAINN